ncbi:MAG: decaprenyl-phosphate phosphoribosyltransferase [Bacteroidota bacterium]
MNAPIRNFIVSFRPQQWIKNLILFAPLIFSEKLFDIRAFGIVSMGFVLFSLAASGIYTMNDLADTERDKQHPVKSQRPIVSGVIPPGLAAVVAFLLMVLSVTVGFLVNSNFGVFILVYVLLNIAYSYGLKNIVILDVMTVAIGFVLRVLAGAVIVYVPASEWLIICTLLLSLFLGFSKRRHELNLLDVRAADHRNVLGQYSAGFLDQMIAIVTAATVMSYALYTISNETVQKFGTTHLYYTIPFVLYGIFRYLYLIHKRDEGGNPTHTIITDVPLIVNVAIWIVVSVMIIYFHVL